jgi:DNA-binding response OmpR family regulator
MSHQNLILIATQSPWGDAIADRFRDRGWPTRVISDGIDAISSLAKYRPQALVLDVTLPNIDGKRLCMKLAGDLDHDGMVLLPVVDQQAKALTARLEAAGIAYLLSNDDLGPALERMLEGKIRAGTALDIAKAAEDRPRPARTRPLILLVDDDRHELKMLTRELRRFDVDIKSATGGRKAVFVAYEAKPDLIITDYSMPDGNGEYFLGQLRQEPSLSKTPVIVVTGWTFEGGADKAHERDMTGRYGAAAYLQKPVDLNQLIIQIEQHFPLEQNCSLAS